MRNEADTTTARNANLRTLMILVSIWLLICCLVGSAGYGSYYFMSSSAEKAQSETATARGIATDAAATSQVFATATGISQATQIAGYEIYDNYNSNPHHWEIGIESNDYWNGVIGIRNGAYVWDIREAKDPNFYSWRGYDQKKAVQDFDLSVDAKLDKGASDLLCYGVAFRASPRDFNSGAYLFSVCDSGVYEVEYNNDLDGSKEIVPWTPSEAIRSDGSNTLSVHARGEKITLSINNQVVDEFTDQHLIKGYVYLLVQAFDGSTGTIRFDNFAFQPR
jgi:hypothetical protein